MKKITTLTAIGLVALLLAGCASTPMAGIKRTGNDIDGPLVIRGPLTVEGDFAVTGPYVTAISGPATLSSTTTLSGESTLSNVPIITMDDGAVITTPISPTIATISRITSVNNAGYTLMRTVWTLTNYRLAVTDSGANGGHAGVLLMTLPTGHFKVLSGHQTMVVVAGSGSITATAAFDFALGSTATATDNEVLSTTEQDITTKEDGTLSSSTLTFDTLNATAVDLESTASKVYLNCAITAATISATEDLICTGTLTVNWMYMGED